MPSSVLEIHGMRPADEILPADQNELGEVLARANREGAACCIAGGATKGGWGNPPRRFDLLVGTAGLHGFSDVDPDNLTMSVAVGTTIAEARARAEGVNRILPLDPGNPGRATIGGVVATGDQGARAAGFGGLRDVVLGVRATLADGSTVKFGGRTMKNVTGYDMTKLFVGSFGILGVITEVTFRLLPRYDSQALAVLPLSSLDEAKATVARVLDSYLQPLALEVVSAGSLPAEFASSTAKLPEARRTAIAPATAGAPIAPGRPLLLAGFGGHRAAVDRSVREVTQTHTGAATILRDHEAEALYEHLANSGAAGPTVGTATGREAAAAGGRGPSGSDRPCLGLRASLPISRAFDLVIAAQRYAQATGLALDYRAGAARGRVDLLFGAARPEGTMGDGTAPRAGAEAAGARTVFTACLTQMRSEAAALGGSLFVTGDSGLLSPGYDAWGEIGPSLTLMRRLKERFDPKGVLNAGRFVGGL